MEAITCHEGKHGDCWVTNDSKMWITEGPDGDTLIVYILAAPKDQDSKAITAFIVEKEMIDFLRGTFPIPPN